MNSRERFMAALRRQMPDRVPRSDGFPWPETLQRWQVEGLAKDQAIHDVLDLDRIGGAHFPADIGYPGRLLQETAKAGGGYIHHSDHSVPPTVSWATYCYWQALARKHGGK